MIALIILVFIAYDIIGGVFTYLTYNFTDAEYQTAAIVGFFWPISWPYVIVAML